MAHYEDYEGLKYIMEQKWDTHKDEFPSNKGDYVQHYKKIEDFLNEKFHPEVNIGAAASGDVLTDHGADHVQMVIRYAFKLLENGKCEELKGYEIFILLLAIHFHDVGNISGRDKHESKIINIMNELGNIVLLDTVEKRFITDIAVAHGGIVYGSISDKDTLKLLQQSENCNGIKIRPAMLASILRFADELSDDNTRAKRFVNIENKNNIYHEYSKSLSPITFSGKTIEFAFNIEYTLSIRKIPINDTEDYLYDEILRRLKKCMCELEYCRKYSEGFIDITNLSIEVNVLDKENNIRRPKCFKFTLRLSGYPNINEIDIESLITEQSGIEYRNGESLKKVIEDTTTIEEKV